jgi:hypothetical protein
MKISATLGDSGLDLHQDTDIEQHKCDSRNEMRMPDI